MHIFRSTYRRLYGIVNANFTYAKLSTLAKGKVNNYKQILIYGLIPVIPTISAQSSSSKEENNSDVKPVRESNESKQELDILDNKTPWERVKAIYEYDEYGNLSKELTATLNSCYMSMFVGFMYGGVQKSRLAFVDFMERNQATIFENHLDAKRKLQNHVTIHFGKGAIYWMSRLTIFTGGFMLTFFMLQAYRGSTSILDYTVSCAVIGALMRLKLGPPGIVVGGAVGGILGLLCGVVNQSILSIYGASYDDILSAQWKVERDRSLLFDEAIKRDFEKRGQVPKEAFQMLKTHDDKPTDI